MHGTERVKVLKWTLFSFYRATLLVGIIVVLTVLELKKLMIITYAVREVRVRYVIRNKCLGFYDIKGNKRYTFFMNSSIKL